MRTINQTATQGNSAPPVKAPTPPLDVEQLATPPKSVISPDKTAQLSVHYDRLTWARTCIKDVQYNATVKAWLEHDHAFANWLRTCVMLHADSGAFETKCTIPDQWREDVGVEVTIVSANAIPVRQGEPHKVVEGVYHVMV